MNGEQLVPDLIADGTLLPVVSMSGGKDSTATALHLRELGIEARHVFADTGWEAPETYAYLDLLRSRLGLTIDVVGVPGGMVEKIRHRAGFPARMQRWCTRELKLRPLRDYHDRIESGGTETACVVGVRAAESEARSKLCAREDDETWGGWIWRPLLTWGVEDVIAIHRRHGVPMNPLYHRGHNRVGCYPCIFATKEEIRLTAEHAPWRIDEIRALEAETTALRAQRNEESPGRYAHAHGTFFQGRAGRAGGRTGHVPIDDAVEWSRTTKGGRQLPLLPPAPDGGCFRWGLCEPPDGEKP